MSAPYRLVKLSDEGAPDLFAIRHDTGGIVAAGYAHVMEALQDVAWWNAKDCEAEAATESARSWVASCQVFRIASEAIPGTHTPWSATARAAS